jgi:hypothetical protein
MLPVEPKIIEKYIERPRPEMMDMAVNTASVIIITEETSESSSE